MGVPVGAGSVTFCGLDAGHTAGSRSRASGAVESTPAGGFSAACRSRGSGWGQQLRPQPAAGPP